MTDMEVGLKDIMLSGILFGCGNHIPEVVINRFVVLALQR